MRRKKSKHPDLKGWLSGKPAWRLPPDQLISMIGGARMRSRPLALVAVMVFHLVAAFPGYLQATLHEIRDSDHLHPGQATTLDDWDTTVLQARIFLGRLPATMPGSESDTPERIALGKKLYFERAISCSRTQSCHDCHLLTEGRAGADEGPTSKGAWGSFGRRNSPTVINAGFQAFQFWDGRASDLAEQAKGPIIDSVEMAMSSPSEAMANLRKLDGYEDAFRRAFPGDSEPFTFDRLGEAIASFERTLVAPGRFDTFLDGQTDAINLVEKRGLTKFIDYRCVECHTGATVGGQTFKKIGQRHPYTGTEDLGRYEVTKRDEDRFVFKVPMLRNVTRTPPYFSDGKVATLRDAVMLMGWHQLGLRLTSDDIDELIAFLSTLEGNPTPPIEAP